MRRSSQRSPRPIKGWNNHVHREFPGIVESTHLSRDHISREIGRSGGAPRSGWSAAAPDIFMLCMFMCIIRVLCVLCVVVCICLYFLFICYSAPDVFLRVGPGPQTKLVRYVAWDAAFYTGTIKGHRMEDNLRGPPG